MVDPQGKIQGTAHGRKRAQKIAHNEPEMHAEPKAFGESHAQAHLNPPQGQKGTNGDETEEASEGRKRAQRRRKRDTGDQGTGEDRRRSGQEQEPSDEFKPRKKILDRSSTPPPSSRKDHQGTSEAPTWRQLETVEAPRNRQGRTSGPTAVP